MVTARKFMAAYNVQVSKQCEQHIHEPRPAVAGYYKPQIVENTVLTLNMERIIYHQKTSHKDPI